MFGSDVGEVGAKNVTVKFKTDGLAEGEFIGYASVFGNKDEVGDVVVKGAFAKTLAEWERKGVPIPVYWEHNTSDPDFNLGHVLAASEDDRGLKIHGRLDMESPKAATTYRLLKAGRVNQMSFAYKVLDGAYVEPAGENADWRDSYFELRELDLYEVSVVPIGANQQTEILAVKTAAAALAAKAGRALSAKNEDVLRGVKTQLTDAASSVEEVLSSIGDGEAGKAQDQTSGAEPPPGPKSAPGVATPSPSVSLALLEMEIDTYAQGDIE